MVSWLPIFPLVSTCSNVLSGSHPVSLFGGLFLRFLSASMRAMWCESSCVNRNCYYYTFCSEKRWLSWICLDSWWDLILSVLQRCCFTGECWASGAAPLELGHIQGAVSAVSMAGCSIFRLIPHMKACSFSTQSRGAATESVFDAGFQDVQLSHSVAHTHFTLHHLDFVLITGLQTHMEFTQDDNTKIQLKTLKHAQQKYVGTTFCSF